MKIQEQDIYHGAALTQIVEHESFKALNKGSSRYGHYLVNADCHVFVKYSRAENSPWQYTISPEQLEPIANVAGSTAHVYLCLVCGHQTICLLGQEQIEELIELGATDSQWIRVEVPQGGGCRVTSRLGRLGRVVPHNAFPSRLFEAE